MVAGEVVVEKGMVRGSLHVRLAAQRVDAAAGHADVAEQKLDDGRSTDVLHAHRMLSPADGVQDGAGLVRFARGAEDLVDLHEVFFRYARNLGDVLQSVTGVVFRHDVEYAAFVLEREVANGCSLLVALEGPGRAVVCSLLGVVAAEETVLEVVRIGQNIGGVGVVHHIVPEPASRFDDVVDHASEEGDVRT